jgi:putative nucleotidyltransferase with HDIG domain
MLLRLSLVFPDRAPSRYAMARGAGNIRVLEGRIREARDGGVDPEPVRAAEQILGLVAALSAHDRRTRGHSERVRVFTDLIAEELRLPDDDRDRLRWAALLHDIGKLRVPARILNKPGRPEPREWETLKRHPLAGARIAGPLLAWLGPWGRAIEQHHERWDGAGYPFGIGGSDISLGARIVSVADSFEVMTAPRSYRRPMSVPAARRELADHAGGQFDPAIVRAFLRVSLGRLWWTVGPASWTAVLPVLGPAQRASGQVAAAATGATAALFVGAAGLVPVVTGTAAAPSVGSGPPATVTDAGTGAPGGGDDVGPTRTPFGAPEDDGTRSGGDADDGTRTDGGGEPVATDPAEDPGDGVVADPAGVVGRTLRNTADASDGVVDGAGTVVDGVVDGATDAVDETLGSDVGGVLDEPVDGVTDVLGGLLGR